MRKISRKTTKERRKEVVGATLDLIGEKGIESLRTSEIAERVGFSEAALYKHFSNKKEVVRATISFAGEKLIGTLSAAIDDIEVEDNLEKLHMVLEAHLKFIENNPGITRLLFSDEIHFNEEDLRNELLGIIQKYHDFVKNLLERGIERGDIRDDLDLEATTTFYLGLIQSQILFWSLSGGEKSLDEQANALWGLYRELVKC